MMHTGHFQRNSTVDLAPTKQHSPFPKWDTGPTTTPEQHPTKSQIMLPRPHGTKRSPQPSPVQKQSLWAPDNDIMYQCLASSP